MATKGAAPRLTVIAVVLTIALLFGGRWVYDHGIETGRAEERQHLRLMCDLARLGADNLIEAATICIEAIRD